MPTDRNASSSDDLEQARQASQRLRGERAALPIVAVAELAAAEVRA